MESALRRSVPPGLTIIETLRWQEGRAVRWDRHATRMASTARRLHVPAPDFETVLDGLPATGTHRLRLTLDTAGTLERRHGPLGATPRPWRLGLAGQRLDAANVWRAMKTSARAPYDLARAEIPPGLDEVLLLNAAGEIADGTITNVFVLRAGRLVTPPTASGCLPGVLRGYLIDRGRAGEARLTVGDLRGADAVYVGNSLRGLIRCALHLP